MEGQARCECPPPYIRTIPGILKIVEIVFTILTFALSFGGGNSWSREGGGWVEFVGISSFIIITIWFILHLINLVPRIMVNYLIEFISYCVMVVFLIIAGIVAAAFAGRYANAGNANPSVGACAFFAFAAAIVCAVDAVLQFLEYRQGGTFQTSSQTTTTVTTTSTSSSAVKVEY